METHKTKVALVSDENKKGLRVLLKGHIEKGGIFEVFLSRAKISRIRREIISQSPELIFATADVFFDEEFNELLGFIKKTRRHFPNGLIVIHTPRLIARQQEEMFEFVDAWVDDNLAYIYLEEILEAITSREISKLSQLPRPSQVITKRQAS